MRNAILHLNWPMVLAAAAAYYAVGAVWYTVLFGKYWARSYNMNMSERKGAAQSMIFGFLLTIVITATIGLLINKVGGKEWTDHLIRSYILVAGMIVGLVGTAVNYQRKPFGIWFVDIGYHLIGALVATFILSRWGMSSGSM